MTSDEKREKQKKYRNDHRRRAQDLINKLKAVPCADCGVEYPPCVMQFDHVRGEKAFTIGGYGITLGVERLIAEIAKCDVVCANCHALRTWLCGD